MAIAGHDEVTGWRIAGAMADASQARICALARAKLDPRVFPRRRSQESMMRLGRVQRLVLPGVWICFMSLCGLTVAQTPITGITPSAPAAPQGTQAGSAAQGASAATSSPL